MWNYSRLEEKKNTKHLTVHIQGHFSRKRVLFPEVVKFGVTYNLFLMVCVIKNIGCVGKVDVFAIIFLVRPIATGVHYALYLLHMHYLSICIHTPKVLPEQYLEMCSEYPGHS